MSTLAVVDAGPLYAAVDADDDDHLPSRDALGRGDLRLVIPAMVIAEATYFVRRRLGAAVVALAERLQATTVVTLDRRHFAAVVPRHCDAFALLP